MMKNPSVLRSFHFNGYSSLSPHFFSSLSCICLQLENLCVNLNKNVSFLLTLASFEMVAQAKSLGIIFDSSFHSTPHEILYFLNIYQI